MKICIQVRADIQADGDSCATRYVIGSSAQSDGGPKEVDREVELALISDNAQVWAALSMIEQHKDYTITIEDRQYPGESGEVVEIVTVPGKSE